MQLTTILRSSFFSVERLLHISVTIAYPFLESSDGQSLYHAANHNLWKDARLSLPAKPTLPKVNAVLALGLAPWATAVRRLDGVGEALRTAPLLAASSTTALDATPMLFLPDPAPRPSLARGWGVFPTVEPGYMIAPCQERSH